MNTKTSTPPAGLVVPEQRRQVVDFSDAEIRTEGGTASFVGHAAVYDRLSEDLGGFKERIMRGAFRKVLDKNPDVRFLFNHDPNYVLGRTTASTLELNEDPRGLRVFSQFPETQWAKDLSVSIKRGDISQMSFGFMVGEDYWEEEDGEVIRTIRSFDNLIDVSVVTYPAYVQTDVSLRSICGVEIGQGNDIDSEALRQLAQEVHQEKIEATIEDRAKIDAAFTYTELVSPWIEERVSQASADELETKVEVQKAEENEINETAPVGRDEAAARTRALTIRRHELSS